MPSALATLALLSIAQAQLQPGNLTIIFSSGDEQSCASPSNISDARAISFTTRSVPVDNQCFNLDKLFWGPSVGNITQNLSRITSTPLHTNGTTSGGQFTPLQDGEYNISYALENQDIYNPETNYNQIYYEQLAPGGARGRGSLGLPNNTAARVLRLFWDQDCMGLRNESAPSGEDVVPTYAYSCVSEGQCNFAAAGVKSFEIGDTAARWNVDGDSCQDFSSEGAVVSISRIVVALATVAGAWSVFWSL